MPKGVCFKGTCLFAQDPDCSDGVRVTKSLRFAKPHLATDQMNMQIIVDDEKKVVIKGGDVSEVCCRVV